MQNNKVFSILQKFDKYEQNRLRKFVQSPYFNRNERLEKLLELLIKDLNKENPIISLNREEIWTKVGHQSKYDDVKLRKDFSDLLRLIEKFIAQEEYEKDGLYEAEFLLTGIRNKKIEKLESGAKKAASRLLERYSLKSSDFFYHQFLIEKKFFLSSSSNVLKAKSGKSNIETVAENLDIFYVSEKMRYYCYSIESKLISVHQYDLNLMDEIIAYIQKSNLKEVPVIAIYYQKFLTLIDEKNEKHYFRLKNLLDKYALGFPKEEAFLLYSSTLNYCVGKINSGNGKFLQEYLDIIVDFLEKGIIFLNDYLATEVFNNIVVTALRLEKFIWAEKFIVKYNKRIDPQYQENVITFNMARLHWYQKNHEKVIGLLREVEYDNLGYNLKSKTMLLLTYYEVDEIEPLFSLLESFRAFLNRHKEIPDSRRQNYLNLIRFTKKLTKTIPRDKKAIEKLHKEITETKSLANKDWLLEKLAELK